MQATDFSKKKGLLGWALWSFLACLGAVGCVSQSSPLKTKPIECATSVCLASEKGQSAAEVALDPRLAKIDFDQLWIPSDLLKAVSEDLSNLATFQLNSPTPLHRKIFGDQDHLGFFVRRIREVTYVDHPDFASLIAHYVPDEDVVALGQGYLGGKYPQVVRQSILIHESRHADKENQNWPHKVCPIPFVDQSGVPIIEINGFDPEGLTACDDQALGSYGVQIVFLKNIEKSCRNCTEKVRADAGLFGDNLMSRMISKKSQDELIQDLYGGVSTLRLRLYFDLAKTP